MDRTNTTPDLPPPLRGTDPDSFARHTVTTRLPNQVRQVIEENTFGPDLVARLERLARDIPKARIRPLQDAEAPDAALWVQYVRPHTQQTWEEVPWLFAEVYLYRRILEATGYFQAGAGRGVDPYGRQKRQGLEGALEAARLLAARLQEGLQEKQQGQKDDETGPRALLEHLVVTALWGNQADLSLWSAEDGDRPNHLGTERERAHILVDDTGRVADLLLTEGGLDRVDVLGDNAGFELVCDLGLVDFLLSTERTPRVNLHLKDHPTFVSDAVPADLYATLAFLAGDEDPATRALGERLQRHVEAGRLRLHTHPFWTAPYGFREMPAPLRDELGPANLVISKGDANYRRFLGDRHWPFTTPFAEVVVYFPAPLLALRTLKSEVAAGLTAEQLACLDAEDPDWRVNGEWGLVQFVEGGEWPVASGQ